MAKSRASEITLCSEGGSEVDVRPSGADADGYLSGEVHFPDSDTSVHADIFTHLYDRGQGAANRDAVGEVLYNRGLVAAMWTAEAIRYGHGHSRHQGTAWYPRAGWLRGIERG